jgi:hypothetical protein
LEKRKLFKLDNLGIVMAVNMDTLHSDMLKIQREIALLRNVLLSEGELSDWAKEKLEVARLEDESSYTDLEDL